MATASVSQQAPVWRVPPAQWIVAAFVGAALIAAAFEEVDATPMEGFNPSAVNNILGLQEKGLHAVALAALGYRHVDDKQQHLIKVRKSQTELFITL